MLKKSILRTITAVSAALGVNIVPAAGFLWAGWAAETTMLLYLLETAISIPLAGLRVRLLAPAREDIAGAKPLDRGQILSGYFLFTGGFTFVCGIFILVFIFLIMDAPVDLVAVRSGLLVMAVFQLFGFFSDLAWLRPLPLARAQTLLNKSMGRVALLYVAVFTGVCAALVHPSGFLVPFIGLKTMVDVGEPIQFLLKRGQVEPAELDMKIQIKSSQSAIYRRR